MRRGPAVAVFALLSCAPVSCASVRAGEVSDTTTDTTIDTKIDSWAQMRAALVGCWSVPPGTEGSVMAFRFLFAPGGGLRGPPRIMARILKGEDTARRAYEASAYAALDRCLPFALTPHFKAIMGGTLVQLRFVNTPREPALNLGSAITIFAEETRRP